MSKKILELDTSKMDNEELFSFTKNKEHFFRKLLK